MPGAAAKGLFKDRPKDSAAPRTASSPPTTHT
eukprot:CAMPEP_0177481554 /NCGR_PEP_ID=MMETSP0369-20130122/26444_1 /TAXON_ID=447022 ORGANISM="Scrippsiella hangoei-like, Strain SHHI-4" /NCGR_SAMPLE_ID=MMETSP0369 /ASSEMBLY_ACC=CAM_ASM_000364 /LENGTH=31 /DNA_ID= /DNA_START= /DNA_END= /DNA_ORIENTATION=